MALYSSRAYGGYGVEIARREGWPRWPRIAIFVEGASELRRKGKAFVGRAPSMRVRVRIDRTLA